MERTGEAGEGCDRRRRRWGTKQHCYTWWSALLTSRNSEGVRGVEGDLVLRLVVITAAGEPHGGTRSLASAAEPHGGALSLASVAEPHGDAHSLAPAAEPYGGARSLAPSLALVRSRLCGRN